MTKDIFYNYNRKQAFHGRKESTLTKKNEENVGMSLKSAMPMQKRLSKRDTGNILSSVPAMRQKTVIPGGYSAREEKYSALEENNPAGHFENCQSAV